MAAQKFNTKGMMYRMGFQHTDDQAQRDAFERGFRQGKLAAKVDADINLAIEILSESMNHVLDCYILAQRIPITQRIQHITISLIALGNEFGCPIHEDLLNAIEHLVTMLNTAQEYYQKLNIPRPFDPDYLFENDMLNTARAIEESVRNLLDTDDGADLIAAIEKYQTIKMQENIKFMLKNPIRVGRKAKETGSKQWLQAMWQQYEKESSDPATVRDRILSGLGQPVTTENGVVVPGKYVMNDGLSDIQKQAFKSLTTKTALERPSQYRSLYLENKVSWKNSNLLEKRNERLLQSSERQVC